MTADKVKTGTTCIGLLFKDGVMLAADRRVTTYKIESDMFTKIFDVSDNTVATIAGHASPAQLFMRHLKSEIKLLELKKERKARKKSLNQVSSFRILANRLGLITRIK